MSTTAQLTTYTKVLTWLQDHGYVIYDTNFSPVTRMASIMYSDDTKNYDHLVFFIDGEGVIYRYDETGERNTYFSIFAIINS